MKKIYSTLWLFATSLFVFAQDFPGTYSAPSGTICWQGEFFSNRQELREWDIIVDDGSLLQIQYQTSFETLNYSDNLEILEENYSGNYTVLATVYGISSGSVSTSSTSGHVKLRLWTYFGANAASDGFIINYNSQNTNSVENLYVTNKLGIGTIAPLESLHVIGSICGEGLGHGIDIGSEYKMSIGSSSAYTRFYTNSSYFFMNKPLRISGGQIGSATSNLSLQTNGTTRMTILRSNGNIGIGTENPIHTLDVRGTIRANEIRVNIPTGADFVFEEKYQLRSLKDVEDFITQYQHLPEIPSAVEMEEKGLSINEFQIQLLQKIEELTLYTILQQKEIEELKLQINFTHE